MDGARELFTAAVAPVNLAYTLLVAAVVLYWVTVILGLLDAHVLDLDAPGEGGADVDGGAHAHGLMWGVLGFFNLGKVPTSILLSFLFVSLWAGSLLANQYLRNDSLPVALGLFVPNLLAGLIVTKILSVPFARLFRSMDGTTVRDRRRLVGSRCTVVTSEATKELGQAEIRTGAAPLRLDVRAAAGHSLGRGQEAVITEYDDQRRVYIIRPLESED